MTETRKLAAILAADVVGYSRLAGADEERTLARLRALRSDLIDPTIAVHHGRVVKRTGDGALIEFRSVVDAVRCAVEVQNGMVERNAGVPEDRRIEFRIGVHLGDVVEEADGDLMGDGVNIAARLEGIAEPGGICLSEDAFRQVGEKLEHQFVDLGEKDLKNIARPVRVYRLATDHEAATSGAATSEIIEAASRVARQALDRGAAVPEHERRSRTGIFRRRHGRRHHYRTVAHQVAVRDRAQFELRLQRKAVDIRRVGRELGVRYVLEGGVRKAGSRLRISAQLLEAETGAHVWADRFDGGVADVFDLQDQITDKVVGIVEPSLRRSEIERSRRKRPDSLDAYDLYLRATPYMASVMPADARKAAGYLEEVLKIDPGYVAAHALLAWCHEICFTTEPGFVEAERLAGVKRIVIAGTTDDATALAIAALAISHLDRDYLAALNAIERALSLNASCATALYFGAHVHAFNGNIDVARSYAHRALRLSPFDPFTRLTWRWPLAPFKKRAMSKR